MKNIALFLSILTLFLSTGCSNYRLAGTPVDLPFSSVYVKPVRNDAYVASASQLITNAISNAINQTPQLKTALQGEAQAILSTTIIDYRKVPMATRPDDTALAFSYAMEMVVLCTLERSNGEVIFKNRKVSARAMLYNSGDSGVIGNEYQNMPVLAREIGGKIKDAVIGIW